MLIPTVFLLYPVLLVASNSQAFAFHLAGGPPASSKIPMASSDQPPTSVDKNALNTKGATFPVPTEDLSIDRVRKTIHACCMLTNDRAASTGYFFRNGNQDDMPALKLLLSSDEDVEADTVLRLMRDFDLFHSVIIEEESSGKIVGFAICYWAYSTWEGRYLYVNKIIVSPSGDDDMLATSLETSLVYTLADAAVRLGGQRLVWQHYIDKTSFYSDELGAETLDGWLTLRMSPAGMESFLSSRGLSGASKTIEGSPVQATIRQALDMSNEQIKKSSSAVKLHLATEANLEDMERLVDGLAVYDKEVGVIHVNQEHYRVDGFTETSEPMFHCLLLEDEADQQICGMAVFYFGYDIEKGRFLYLEDLYIDETYRQRGYGTQCMATLASIASSLGCEGFVWQALDWSTAALNFYDKIGGKILEGRLTTRFNGDVLRSFVTKRPMNV